MVPNCTFCKDADGQPTIKMEYCAESPGLQWSCVSCSDAKHYSGFKPHYKCDRCKDYCLCMECAAADVKPKNLPQSHTKYFWEQEGNDSSSDDEQSYPQISFD